MERKQIKCTSYKFKNFEPEEEETYDNKETPTPKPITPNETCKKNGKTPQQQNK